MAAAAAAAPAPAPVAKAPAAPPAAKASPAAAPAKPSGASAFAVAGRVARAAAIFKRRARSRSNPVTHSVNLDDHVSSEDEDAATPMAAPSEEPRKKSVGFSVAVEDGADTGERRVKSMRSHKMSLARQHLETNKIDVDRIADHHGLFSLEELQGFKADRSFHHVDPTKLEVYLSEEDFFKHFAMDRAAFNAMPAWKQTAAKKALGIF